MLKSQLTQSADAAAYFRKLAAEMSGTLKGAMAEVAEAVTEDALAAVRKGAGEAVDKTIETFDKEHDTAFEDALREYVASIDATVRETGGTIAVGIGVEARVTASAWSLPWLMRLLEYGGTAFIGGKTVRVPPSPHWRAAARRIISNSARYAKMAEAAIAREVLGSLPKR
jgi:hypothetical protein